MKKTSKGEAPEKGWLIPYYLSGPNSTLYYNGTRRVLCSHSETQEDFEKVTEDGKNHRCSGQKVTADDFKITGLPKKYVFKSHESSLSLTPFRVAEDSLSLLVDREIADYKREYENNGALAFWNKLMEEADHFTVRQWLTKK